VSSQGQDDRTQRAAIRRAAGARGDEVTAWYAEKASGSRLARPELERLKTDARGGGVRRLYVFRLDRLTRTGIRDTLGLLQELEASGCEVVTLADGFSLEGPARDVIVAVLAWAAQMERAALGERISAAIARLKASGKTWGRQKRLSRLEVEEVLAMHDSGRSIRYISAALKIPKTIVGRAVSLKPTSDDTPKNGG
jgi:DNA invertase Pin-like site-specific DNA recombinase